MKALLAAVLEPKAAVRRRLVQGLTQAGLKVSRAQDVAGLSSERLVLLGAGLVQPGRVARAVRKQLPRALVLQAQGKVGRAAHADAVVPLPLSAPDLRARLPELARLQGGRAVRSPEPTVMDPVTGFYTFPVFKEILFIEVKRARRYGLPLALGLISLDPLAKAARGAREQLAAGAALAIRRSLRDTDLPVQFSPERVLLVMPHTELAGALTVAERIRERVAQGTLPSAKGHLRPTVSVGVAADAVPGKDLSLADLVQQAQGALARAQAQGGNRVEFYDRAEVESPPAADE